MGVLGTVGSVTSSGKNALDDESTGAEHNARNRSTARHAPGGVSEDMRDRARSPRILRYDFGEPRLGYTGQMRQMCKIYPSDIRFIVYEEIRVTSLWRGRLLRKGGRCTSLPLR